MPRAHGRRSRSLRGTPQKDSSMSWLLDTDVLCQPIKKHGHPGVIAWLERVQDECYTSTIVIGQIAYWIRKQPPARRAPLQDWFRKSIDLLEGRILSYNTAVAHVWADCRVRWENAGLPMPVEDSYIAATALRHDLTIATGNEKHFQRPGIKVFNPFSQPA